MVVSSDTEITINDDNKNNTSGLNQYINGDTLTCPEGYRLNNQKTGCYGPIDNQSSSNTGGSNNQLNDHQLVDYVNKYIDAETNKTKETTDIIIDAEKDKANRTKDEIKKGDPATRTIIKGVKKIFHW